MTKFGFGERGEGIDLVVECSGAEVCVQTGIWLVKRRGVCIQVGAGPANNLIPMSIFVNKSAALLIPLNRRTGLTLRYREVTLKGSLRVCCRHHPVLSIRTNGEMT